MKKNVLGILLGWASILFSGEACAVQSDRVPTGQINYQNLQPHHVEKEKSEYINKKGQRVRRTVKRRHFSKIHFTEIKCESPKRQKAIQNLLKAHLILSELKCCKNFEKLIQEKLVQLAMVINNPNCPQCAQGIPGIN